MFSKKSTNMNPLLTHIAQHFFTSAPFTTSTNRHPVQVSRSACSLQRPQGPLPHADASTNGTAIATTGAPSPWTAARRNLAGVFPHGEPRQAKGAMVMAETATDFKRIFDGSKIYGSGFRRRVLIHRFARMHSPSFASHIPCRLP